MKYTPENIISLKENEIFVFGSNEGGRHGKGAAKTAMEKFGAIYGKGYGLQGQSFAIPTKDKLLNTLELEEIAKYINYFIAFAKQHPELKFYVTKIGCGLAGYSTNDIKPFFNTKDIPNNIILPLEFY